MQTVNVSASSSFDNAHLPVAPCNFGESPPSPCPKSTESSLSTSLLLKTTHTISPISPEHNDNCKNNNKRRKVGPPAAACQIFDRRGTTIQNPNEQAALGTNDVFFDMNPRWRRAYMQEMHRGDKNQQLVLLCPDDDDCTPVEQYRQRQDPQKKEKRMSKASPADKSDPITPSKKPAFIRENSVPSGTLEFNASMPVYFWHRSKAFDEDQPDSPNSATLSSPSSPDSILQHLSVPAKLGKEHQEGLYLISQSQHDVKSTPSSSSIWSLRALRESLTSRRLNRDWADSSLAHDVLHLSPFQDKLESKDEGTNTATKTITAGGADYEDEEDYEELDYGTPIHWNERLDSVNTDLFDLLSI